MRWASWVPTTIEKRLTPKQTKDVFMLLPEGKLHDAGFDMTTIELHACYK